MTMIEAPTRIPGAERLDLNDRFAIDRVFGPKYKGHVEELIEIAVNFDVGRLHPTRSMAEKMIRKAMEMPDPNVVKDLKVETPSAMFFWRKSRVRETLVGLSTERVYLIDTPSAGVIPFHYWSKRIFIPEVRALHLGRVAVQEGRAIHREATWGGHRTNTDVAAYSFAKSGVFKADKLYPYRKLAKEDRLAQELATGVWMRVRENSTESPNTATLICDGEYDVQNLANEELPPHARLSEDFLEFRAYLKSIGFDPTRRQAIYGVGEFK